MGVDVVAILGPSYHRNGLGQPKESASVKMGTTVTPVSSSFALRTLLQVCRALDVVNAFLELDHVSVIMASLGQTALLGPAQNGKELPAITWESAESLHLET